MIINILKIFLSIILFLCLLEMPYGYYQFVRFISTIGFLYLAYNSYEVNKKKNIAVVWVEKQIKYTPLFYYLVLALLFQPFFKIALGRQFWNFVDVIVGLGLLLSIIISNMRENK